MGHRHGELLWQCTRLANQVKFNEDVYFAERWPLVRQLFEVRDGLGRLRAHNVFHLGYFELYMHDLYGTRVYHDFAGRPYQPVMTPADADWVFGCDPKNAGEKLGWVERIGDVPDYFRRNAYTHLFFRDWDQLRSVTRWKQKTGKGQVVHGWYQVDFTPRAEVMRPGDVLYFPRFQGSAISVWIDGRAVRRVERKDLPVAMPLVIPLAEAGVTGGKRFRLTVRVSSPDGPGGLIGPAYLARPLE